MSNENKDVDSSYAVIVDPIDWDADYPQRVQMIRKQLGGLRNCPALPPIQELTTRLRGGPTTIFEHISRELAQHIAEILEGHGIQAKMARQVPSSGSGETKTRATQGRWPELVPDRQSVEILPSASQQSDPSKTPLTSAKAKMLSPFEDRNGRQTSQESIDEPAQGAEIPQSSEKAPDPSRTIIGWGDVVGPRPTPQKVGRSASSKAEAGQLLAGPTVVRDMTAEPPAAASPFQLEPPRVVSDDTETTGERSQALQPSDNEDRSPPSWTTPSDSEPASAVPSQGLHPRPWLAGLLSALAPGAGQVYLGQAHAAHSYAIAAPLVFPWIRSVCSATQRARHIRSGVLVSQSPPRIGAALGFALIFWSLIAAVCVSGVLLFRHLTAPVLPLGRAPEMFQVPAGTGESPSVVPPEAALEPIEPRVSEDLTGELQQRERRVRAQRMVLNARAACDAGDYTMCYRLSADARELDAGLPEAIRLFHRARLALEEGSATGLEINPSEYEDTPK